MTRGERRPPELRLPPRRGWFLPGAAFASTIFNMPMGRGREDLICDQIGQGNVPDFLRTLYPVTVTPNVGKVKELTLWVTPDYLSVGTDDDYIRVPMGPRTAQHIADITGTFLPTRQVVNYVHNGASIRLPPTTRVPGPDMTSVGAFIEHNTVIQQQLEAVDADLGQLVSGHKKDVVIFKALEDDDHTDRVGIYGWCYTDGRPIQPLNAKSHSYLYSDYSHGIRLVWRNVRVNGELYPYDQVLTDPDYSVALSDEGPLSTVRYPES